MMRMRTAKILIAAVALAAAATPVMAQSSSFQNYYAFLAQHPELQTALTGNPSLYRSPGFMTAHPTLWSYLQQNPNTYQAMLAKAPAYRPDPGAYALANYLHTDPGVARSLSANPALASNPVFLRQHPNFRTFLRNHPAVHRRLAAREWNFQQWQRYHEWNERNQWRDADDWSDRDWRQPWQREREFEEAEEREEHEEFREHEHHDHGKHLGWYKHPGKHHDFEDDDDEPGEAHAWGRRDGGHHGHHGNGEEHGHGDHGNHGGHGDRD